MADPVELNWLILTGETINLVALQKSVISLWEQHTNRLWDERVDHVQEFWPSHSRMRTVFLQLMPVTTVKTVEEWDGVAYQIVPTTGWASVRKNEIRRIGAYFTSRVRVTYTGGYTNANLPEDIRHALLVQAKFLVDRFGAEKLIIKSQAIKDGSTVYEIADLHPHFRSLAKKRRRRA